MQPRWPVETPDLTTACPDVRDGLLGLCVGDALGVPVEFCSRAQLDRDPVTGLRGYGTHHQPPGTWSDDSSLTFCLVENLCVGGDLRDLGDRFVRWQSAGLWTPYGVAFDIGSTTARAIARLRQGCPPEAAGDRHERSNGNGSLMRILPLAYALRDREAEARFASIHAVGGLTHAHPRAQIACGFYVQLAIALLQGLDRDAASAQACQVTRAYYATRPPFAGELHHFERVLGGELERCDRAAIRSSGYVVHTLEAALWCWLRGETYAETVLSAVNLGDDTDTTGAVAGGLAGITYGWQSIPAAWQEGLAQYAAILDWSARLQRVLEERAGGWPTA